MTSQQLEEKIDTISYRLAVQAYNSPQEELVDCASEFEEALLALMNEEYQRGYKDGGDAS